MSQLWTQTDGGRRSWTWTNDDSIDLGLYPRWRQATKREWFVYEMTRPRFSITWGIFVFVLSIVLRLAAGAL